MMQSENARTDKETTVTITLPKPLFLLNWLRRLAVTALLGLIPALLVALSFGGIVCNLAHWGSDFNDVLEAQTKPPTNAWDVLASVVLLGVLIACILAGKTFQHQIRFIIRVSLSGLGMTIMAIFLTHYITQSNLYARQLMERGGFIFVRHPELISKLCLADVVVICIGWGILLFLHAYLIFQKKYRGTSGV